MPEGISGRGICDLNDDAGRGETPQPKHQFELERTCLQVSESLSLT